MKSIATTIKTIFCIFMFIGPFTLKAQNNTNKAGNNTPLVYGKYGCTSSSYRNGSVEYTPRGSFIITKDGQYTYFGFEKPSKGTYTVDKKGNLSFKGGYFNDGEAEKIDRPNKFFLVFPLNNDHRWTCGLAENK